MSASWDLDAVAAAIAEAAADPSRWNAAMEVAADVTGAFGAVLLPFHGRLPQFPQSRTLVPTSEKYVQDGWMQYDDRFKCLPALVRNGVATEFDFTTPDEMARHPYWQEFLAPHGLRWFAAVHVACGDEQWALSLQRTVAQGPFSRDEMKRLAGLSPKLGSAAALARALGFARADAALGAFEISGAAIVLIDRFGEVLRVNATAEGMLRGDPRIERRRVVSADPDATAALDRALHALMWNRSASALMPPVRLPRRNRRPILAYPARLAAVTADALAACQAVIVLVDPERQAGPPEAALRAGFDLTGAEARLAMRLASGETVEGAADALGIAKETARAQLKSIFAKLDVHRQAELVAVLARLLNGGGR